MTDLGNSINGGSANTLVVITTTSVTSNYTIKSTDQRIEYDASGGNIVVTYPVITAAFKNKPDLEHKRIDTSLNTVNFIGTSGNYEDENFQLGNDPQLESIKTYASNDGTWRRAGYGLPEQKAYYDSLSTGLISLTGDPTTLITDNGDGTMDINHGGDFRIVDRTDTFNFISRSRLRSFVATSNIDHTASGADGNKVIIIDNTGTISIIALPKNSSKLSADEGSGIPNFNTHLQIGTLTKNSGTVNNFIFLVTINNNIFNNTRFFLDSIGIINTIMDPQDIVISGNNDLKLKYTKGSSLLTDTGFKNTGGLSLNQNKLIADIVDVPIISVTRDGLIDSISTDLNVVDIESPIGTLTPMSNNQAANRYILGFADEEFVVALYGQIDFGTIAAAALAPDLLANIDLTQFGTKLRKISVNKNETDNANFIFTLLNQFM